MVIGAMGREGTRCYGCNIEIFWNSIFTSAMGDHVLEGKAAKYDFILFTIDPPLSPYKNYVQTYPLTPSSSGNNKIHHMKLD